MDKTLAFVAPWYGDNIPGGAEAACRSLAKALAARGLNVEVLTTCVRDFRANWSENYHPAGATSETGILVRRFPVRGRDTRRFDEINAVLMQGRTVSRGEEQAFLAEMINSPALYDYMRRHCDRYIFLFIPYMFATTYWGSRACPEQSILIPCLHDEAYARFESFREMSHAVRGAIFLSEEEKDLAVRLYGIHPDKTCVGGLPVDCAWTGDGARFARKYGLRDFILYAGRADKGKNADLLIDYYCRYAEDVDGAPKLVFIGDANELHIPRSFSDRIVKLGFVPQQDKYDAYAAAAVLCVPSVVESFSIVMMESWLAGTPVLANADCAVTAGHCRRSNGGLYFSGYEVFREMLMELMRRRQLAATLGRQGREYVLHRFSHDRIADTYLGALHRWALL
ncbi:MAG: glycosyltransferase family 4 protein [Terriglobales bacterium]